VELLQPLFASVTGENRSAEQRFNPGLARLYSKAWSADFLRKLLARIPAADWLCTEAEVGVAVHSLAAALAAIAGIRARGHHPVIVKQAFGVAGGNALRLFEPHLLEPQKRWLAKAFERGRELVVEPWLAREADFSIQLEMTASGLKLCGYTGLVTDARGQFLANVAESHHHQRIPAAVVARFTGPADISRRLLDFYAAVFTSLEAELRAADFLGPIGIDAFVYRDAAGAIKLKPVVELNPRFTMGRLLVELMRQACQGSFGRLRVVNRAQLRAEGIDQFPDYARSLAKSFPVQLAGEPDARLRAGALCLNDPLRAQACLAVFQVGRTAADLGV
jgi:hypothetical protein